VTQASADRRVLGGLIGVKELLLKYCELATET